MCLFTFARCLAPQNFRPMWSRTNSDVKRLMKYNPARFDWGIIVRMCALATHCMPKRQSRIGRRSVVASTRGTMTTRTFEIDGNRTWNRSSISDITAMARGVTKAPQTIAAGIDGRIRIGLTTNTKRNFVYFWSWREICRGKAKGIMTRDYQIFCSRQAEIGTRSQKSARGAERRSGRLRQMK